MIMKRKNNSRAIGNAYERQIRLELIDLGFEDCQTTRFASHSLDSQGLDFIGTSPFQIQAKRWKRAPNFHKVLADMPHNENYNVVLWKQPRVGEVAVMSKIDFYELIKMLKTNQIL